MLYFTVVEFVFCLLLTFTCYMGPSVLFAGYVLMRCSGLVPYEIMYVYVAEILPTSHRNTGISLGNGMSKGVGCLLPLLLLPLVAHPPRFREGNEAIHSNGTMPLGEGRQPIIEADPLSREQKGVAMVSVPYLILTISCIVAAILLAASPDPTESLYDTVPETDDALESARSSFCSRKLHSCS